MNALFFIAYGDRYMRTIAVWAAIFLGGCSALPQPPVRATLYDFGPGAVSETPAASAPALPTLALADVDTQGLADTSAAVYYRLAYADAHQLRPYMQARWSQPPATLVQQRLRERLGQRRAILQASDTPAARGSGKPTAVLRVALEEFSQVFQSPSQSSGLLRLRATVLDAVPAGEVLVAQRVFVVQRPAPSADAAGGARALAEATDQAAQDLAQWLEALGR